MGVVDGAAEQRHRGETAIEPLVHFVELVTSGGPPSLARLSRALDELAVYVQTAPAGEPADEDVDLPARNYAALCASLRSRFPGLGYYTIADPLGNPEEKPMVGDSIDDLADIVGDLEKVLWRLGNVNCKDAFWHLAFLFQIHFGRHLRELSLYLHARLHYAESGIEPI